MNIEDLDNFLASHPYSASTRRTDSDILSRIFESSQDLSKMRASELIEILNNSGWGTLVSALHWQPHKNILDGNMVMYHPASKPN